MKLGGESIAALFSRGIWRAYRGDTLLCWDEVSPLVGPNSVDVTLSSNFLIPRQSPACFAVDPHDPNTLMWEKVQVDAGHDLVFHPAAFMLGSVQERFVCDAALEVRGRKAYFAPMYEGRSSCGRLGLASHITAGFGDYGFGGAFTLELYNHLPYPIILRPGMRIGQVAFEEVHEPKRYQGSYAGSDHHSGPVPPRLGPDRF